MTDDRMLLGLLQHAAAARAKVVMVGDHRQLGAVGPGGGFEALVARYGAAVHILADNVRQRDVAERAALAQLRDGNVATAVATYARRGQIVVAPDRVAALTMLVEGWATEVATQDSVAMYAYRRANVAELNRRARDVWRCLGRLEGPELVAPGGTHYAVGDRVVALAPGADGKVVTSATATVVSVNVEAMSLSIRLDDDNEIVKLAGEEIAADRLALAYAVTVHRSQGSTVERSHALEDGGGRELAYVKMSRAKDRSTVYVVADSLEQATEDLVREWGTDRRLGWVIDTGTPLTDPHEVERSRVVPRPTRDALRRGRLVAERDAILAVVPPDPAAEIRAAELQRRRLEEEREDLATGTGRYRDHPVAQALRDLRSAESDIARLERNLAGPGQPWKQRRAWRAQLERSTPKLAEATRSAAALTAPESARLENDEQGLSERLSALEKDRERYQSWTAGHPEVEARLDRLTAEIASLDESLDRAAPAHELPPSLQPERWAQLARSQGRNLGLDLGR